LHSIQRGHASSAQQVWSAPNEKGWKQNSSGAMRRSASPGTAEQLWGPPNESGWRQNAKGEMWHLESNGFMPARTSDTIAPQGVTQPANPPTYAADSTSRSSHQPRHASTAQQEWSEKDEHGWEHHSSGAIYNPASKETWSPANVQTGWRQNQKGDLWKPSTGEFIPAEEPLAPAPGRAPGERREPLSVERYWAANGPPRDPAPVVARLEEAWARAPVEEKEPLTPIDGGSW
jgi:hypothetical protein